MNLNIETVNDVQHSMLAKTLPQVLDLLKTSGLSDEEHTAWLSVLNGTLNPPAESSKAKAYPLDLLLDDFTAFSKKIEYAGVTGKRIGPVTGFPKIDTQLCGAFYPGLHVVCGNTGAGKTAWALQVACQCECPALFVSCEMSALELTRRTAARVTETALQKFKDPAWRMPAAAMINRFQKAIEAAPNLIIADSTLDFWDRAKITEHVKIIKQSTGSDHVLVVIDSLNSWAAYLETPTEYDRLNMALTTLRKMALDIECPVLYTAEQTKTSNRENAAGGDVGSSAPAGTRMSEYSAESVMVLRAEMEDVDGIDPAVKGKKPQRPKRENGITPVWFTMHKNRNGAPGESVKLLFDGGFQKFSEA